MNMQSFTNYFCLSYKSSSVVWHFGGALIVEFEPKQTTLRHLTLTCKRCLCEKPLLLHLDVLWFSKNLPEENLLFKNLSMIRHIYFTIVTIINEAML